MSIEDNRLLVKIEDSYLYDLIIDDKQIIQDAINYYGYNLDVEIIKKEKYISKTMQDEIKLKEYIEDLKIKGVRK